MVREDCRSFLRGQEHSLSFIKTRGKSVSTHVTLSPIPSPSTLQTRLSLETIHLFCAFNTLAKPLKASMGSTARPLTFLSLSRSSSTFAASARERSARRSAVSLVVVRVWMPCANWSTVNSRFSEMLRRRCCMASGSVDSDVVGAWSCSSIARWGLSRSSGRTGET